MKKIYIKPIIEVVEMDGDTILAASSGINKNNKTWIIVDKNNTMNIDSDPDEGNSYGVSCAKDFEFAFTEDFEYDF